MARVPNVAARLAAAQIEARRAENKVRRASAGRLAELMRLPADERFAHIDEPTLVTSDRAALRRSVKASLPRRRRWLRVPSRFRGRRARRFLAAILRLALTPELMVPLSIVAAWLGLCWTNTAHIATFTRDVPIRLIEENGHLDNANLPEGRSAIVVVGWDRVARLRSWLPGRGYAIVALPNDAFFWGLPQRNPPQP